jgi:hypothetical protein
MNNNINIKKGSVEETSINNYNNLLLDTKIEAEGDGVFEVVNEEFNNANNVDNTINNLFKTSSNNNMNALKLGNNNDIFISLLFFIILLVGVLYYKNTFLNFLRIFKA